ncbi:MAG: spermidine synthase [Candidatus Tumulicola sp.]
MSDRWRLLLLSFLMLFVELGLIRWIGSNVVYLSYFSNFVLMGSFLGIGVGFLRAKARADLFPWAIVALAFLVGFVLLFPVSIDRSGTELLYFGFAAAGIPMWVSLPVIFLAVASVMALIAQGVGRTFGRFAALEAYRLDILGSLAGIAAFSLLSFLGAPPVVWGAIGSVVFLVLYGPAMRLIQVVSAVGLLVMLGRESMAPNTSWSPYYKVAAFAAQPGVTDLIVNGIPHQIVESTIMRRKAEPLYFLPYERLASNPLRDVLIVGAGSGSDVAIALAAGARHVDAIEIDPRIYAIGRRIHPDRPYQDPRVTVHINDGRAFLERTPNRYDLILFALPDSLVLVSGQSSLRLESYLFTVEAMRAARAHLNPGGAFGMYNYYREKWLIDRYAHTLEVAFGHRPCLDAVGRVGWFALLMVGREQRDVACATVWNSGGRIVPEPASDDYPFPYLRTRSIPPLYLGTLALMLLASLLVIRGGTGPLAAMRGDVDLFFMGAAFLLLETKSVVQFALLFGTTWFVNALVFFGILVAVLAGIEVARRVRFRHPGLLYLALFATLALAWSIEPDRLLALTLPWRFGAATSLAFAPIFLANLVFAQRFRDVESSTIAFGANLLGAMVGGILEYSSLILGYRSLLWIVAVLYGLAFLFARRPVVLKLAATSTDAA